MGNSIDRDDIVWIVTASNHYWGASNSLHEAMQNANLGEPKTPAEFFADELEYRFNLEDAVSNYNDYGKDECKAHNDETHIIIIYRWDPAIWSDYHVSPIDGSVTFTPKDGVDDVVFQDVMNENTIVAEYTDGVLKPKTT